MTSVSSTKNKTLSQWNEIISFTTKENIYLELAHKLTIINRANTKVGKLDFQALIASIPGVFLNHGNVLENESLENIFPTSSRRWVFQDSAAYGNISR